MTHSVPDPYRDDDDEPAAGTKRNWILILVVVLLCLVAVGSGVAAILTHRSAGEAPPARPTDTGTNVLAEVTSQPRETFTVDGSGSVVVDLGRVLNGHWKLEYTVDRYRYIVLWGVRTDGTIDGPKWIAALSEVGQTGVTGSTIISTTDVTMVMAQDVNGPWHLTFTKLS